MNDSCSLAVSAAGSFPESPVLGKCSARRLELSTLPTHQPLARKHSLLPTGLPRPPFPTPKQSSRSLFKRARNFKNLNGTNPAACQRARRSHQTEPGRGDQVNHETPRKSEEQWIPRSQPLQTPSPTEAASQEGSGRAGGGGS